MAAPGGADQPELAEQIQLLREQNNLLVQQNLQLQQGRPAARVQPQPERRRFLEPPTEADLDEQRLYLIPATLTRGPNSHRLPTDVPVNHLFEYCAELELDPLQITPADAAHFLTWLAQRGTVQISSAKPYFSGINQFFKDLGLPGPCEGWLFNRAKSGLVNMQEEIEPSPHELPLPATVAKAIYDRACALGATAASAADNLSLLRALLAVAICFMTMSRPISILLLPTTDLTADPDSAAHCVTVTRQHVKTDHGIDRNQPGRFPLSFPRRFAGLATALRNFTAARAAVYPTATHFFELPGERFTEKTNFGDALGRMLGTALTTVSLQPPEGRVYTARSLRSGGASAAEMVPLPRSKIEFLGGWAVDSKRLSQHYISRATPPTYAGRFFFDWLILPLADNMALDFPS